MSSTSGFAPLKFVSEAEIEEKRKKRQEEWEKVRQPHQPLEAPEDVETRSLFEQLQAQKEAKQLDYEEQHRLKNQIHGLDKEEAEFLDYVQDRQHEIEKERQLEEISALEELRNSVSGQSSASAEVTSLSIEKVASTKVQPGKKRTSQAELLAGAVKRKRSDGQSSNDEATDISESHGSDTSASTAGTSASSCPASQESQCDNCVVSAAASTRVAQIVGVLPGLGDYTDSDHSDTSSSDSDIDTDLFKRDTHSKHGQDAASAPASAGKHQHH